MSFCEIVLHHETAYDCILELGYLGKVQFVEGLKGDHMPNMLYVTQLQRCVESERIIKRLQEEINKNGLQTYYYPDVDTDEIPHRGDLKEIEMVLQKLDTEFTDVQQHCEALQARRFALFEQRQVILKTQEFLTGARNTETQIAHYDSLMKVLLHDSTNGQASAMGDKVMPLNFVAGSIPVDRLASFERMIWRVSRGNAYVKSEQFEIPSPLMERNAQRRYKYAFIVVFVGDELHTKITKICQGFNTRLYHCPETQGERMKVQFEIAQELNDLEEIFQKSCEHKRRVLSAAVLDIYIWRSKVRKIHAIYAVLNQLGLMRELRSSNRKYLEAGCWIPKKDVALVRAALMRGAQRAFQNDQGTLFPPMLYERTQPWPMNRPPTHFQTNKLTAGFQTLIDSYGMASYRELNPAPYTVVTFPFLFAVMFGDVGHGTLMFLFALALVLREKKIEKSQKEATKTNEIFNLLFGGRYIILLMGVFSIYTGIIYNDFLSKSINIFGSSWRVNVTREQLNSSKYLTLDPARWSEYTGSPYVIGVDPVWGESANNIVLTNSVKMKMSIILGVVQMIFGLTLSGANAIFLNSKVDVYLVFLPQLLFMICLFAYLTVLMFHKWLWFGGHNTGAYSISCAPSILITFINMVLLKSPEEPPQGCSPYMYKGQHYVQQILLCIALCCVPILLCGKPLHFMYLTKRIKHIKDIDQQTAARRSTMSSLRKSLIYNVDHPNSDITVTQDPPEKLSEIWIHQGIHTIESVLGSVSHTASYLRLWALSLAHNQLAHVLWRMVLSQGLTKDRGYYNALVIYPSFAFFAVLTVGILVVMEGLSAFLHTLRLHWVEFQSKFYSGLGEPFTPFRFETSKKIDSVT